MSYPSSRTVLRDYVALSELNYIYPWGTLPSNNFFRRIRPNPYYLANELKNIEIELERKPTAYKASPAVHVETDVTKPDHAKAKASIGDAILDDAQKILVGPYFDTVNNQAGVQFNYELRGKLQMKAPVPISEGYATFSFNLLNKPVPSAFTTNLVKYVKIGSHEVDSSCCPADDLPVKPCETVSSDPQGKHTPAIFGTITIFGKDPTDKIEVPLGRSSTSW